VLLEEGGGPDKWTQSVSEQKKREVLRAVLGCDGPRGRERLAACSSLRAEKKRSGPREKGPAGLE
jgi:hypothetical protein